MRIHFLPLVARGYCDISSREIFLSYHQSWIELIDTFKHELAHLLSGCVTHSLIWLDTFKGLRPTNTQFVDILPFGNTYTPNIGNISGVQNILTDYHLLQAYRKFSQKILGTEGHWEVINETPGGGPGDQKIRLYPTPKGAFPVTVLYCPVVTYFRSPQAQLLANEMLVAETKIMVGAARRKITGIPMPDGGSLALDGEALANEGKEEKAAIIEKAVHLGEPLGIYMWSVWPILLTLADSLIKLM